MSTRPSLVVAVGIAVLAAGLLLLGCSKTPVDPRAKSANDQHLLDKVEATVSYTLAVAPSKSVVMVGDCLYFSGAVTQNGVPVAGLSVGVQDPIRQQSIPNAVTTDSRGRFIYNVESMCPAVYNDLVGKFQFKFIVGSTTATSIVNVKPSKPSGLQELSAVNSSLSTYKIKINVDGKNKGMFSIPPGQTVKLMNGNSYGTSNVTATVLNSSGKTLWKATYTDVPSNSPLATSFVNPSYGNFWVATTVGINGTKSNRTLNGIGKFYTDYVNNAWTVGGYKVSVENRVTHGVSGKAELGVDGPGCKTFLGAKARCSASCGASIGLQLCAGWGAGWAIGPGYVGCTAKCCVEVASVKCEVANIGVSAAGTYK